MKSVKYLMSLESHYKKYPLNYFRIKFYLKKPKDNQKLAGLSSLGRKKIL